MKALLKNLWDGVKGRLMSKKVQALMAGGAIWVARKLGLDMSMEMALSLTGLLAMFILGQGIADAGKEKAKLEAANKAE